MHYNFRIKLTISALLLFLYVPVNLGVAGSYEEDLQACFFVGATPEYTISCLTEMLKDYPEDADILVVRGYAYFRKGDFDSAMQDLNQALILDPKNVEALNIRASVKRGLGDEDGALADELLRKEIKSSGYDRVTESYNEDIAKDPNNPDLYAERGAYKGYTLEDHAGALLDFDRYFSMVNGQGERVVFYAKAHSQEQQGDWGGAIETYTACIQAFGENPDPEDFRRRANARSHIGDSAGFETDMAEYSAMLRSGIAEKEQSYSNAIERNPDNPTLYFERAQLRKELEDWEGVLADATKALELFPSDYYQPHVLWCRNLKEEAEKEVSYIGKTPEEVYYMKNKGQIDTLTSILETDPTDHESNWLRSEYRWGSGQYVGAIEDIEKALKAKPNKEAYLEMANELKGSADEMLSEDSSRHLIWWARGKLKWLLGDFEGAIEDMEQAVSLQPEETLYLETLEQMQTDFAAMQTSE
ncbi:tetratricopeptide repeat protein [Desulfatibacillum aliphaticivorans]|uniref:tetratricopeptide repeat protein n=1 Tax=Desulfatibacillum aliphaticivorans TaxID=218208 RepID=UPI0004845799|nr:tetratricopeptide repeat protein [Desulfatibacillum aliphaticivorans]